MRRALTATILAAAFVGTSASAQAATPAPRVGVQGAIRIVDSTHADLDIAVTCPRGDAVTLSAQIWQFTAVNGPSQVALLMTDYDPATNTYPSQPARRCTGGRQISTLHFTAFTALRDPVPLAVGQAQVSGHATLASGASTPLEVNVKVRAT